MASNLPAFTPLNRNQIQSIQLQDQPQDVNEFFKTLRQDVKNYNALKDIASKMSEGDQICANIMSFRQSHKITYSISIFDFISQKKAMMKKELNVTQKMIMYKNISIKKQCNLLD